MVITAHTQWIKSPFGGRKHEPFAGMLPTIRFQRGVKDWLSGGRDVEVAELDFNESDWSATLKLRFANDELAAEEKTRKHLVVDGLFELLDGYRVIAVGKIVGVDWSA